LKKILVAISGASGYSLGLKTFQKIPQKYEKYLILTESAKEVARHEEGVFAEDEIAAGPASGSFGIDITLIVPCSINTLAKIACGIADNLTTRAAAVAIKEHRTLLLAPREIPFDAIALENMQKLATLGVYIASPVLGYYSEPKSLEEMEDFIIGRWFDLVGIEHDLYKRWQ